MSVIQFTKKAFYAMALALLLSTANAASLPGGFQKRGDGAVKLDFSVSRTPKSLIVNTTPTKKRDDGDYEYKLTNKDQYYIADIYVGSNAEKLSVDIDTGSSDLWVIDSSSGISGTYGTYDHSSSSSYEYVASGFEITYADESNASGDWVKDTVALSSSGPTLKGQQFGDATTADGINYGIMGIGLTALEATSSEYDNVPAALKSQGYINKNAYSLFLDSADAAAGSVLFGGIDKSKYSGDLVSFPVTSDTRLNIDVASIGGVSIGSDATLDSGSTISYFAPDLVKLIANKVGATNHYVNGNQEFYYWSDCSDASDIDFSFSGFDVTVPKDLITGGLSNSDGSVNDGCALLIFPDSRFNILGDNFLRNVYAVYNLDDKTIQLAHANYDGGAEDITVIS